MLKIIIGYQLKLHYHGPHQNTQYYTDGHMATMEGSLCSYSNTRFLINSTYTVQLFLTTQLILITIYIYYTCIIFSVVLALLLMMTNSG
jgi:hypothetical protein